MTAEELADLFDCTDRQDRRAFMELLRTLEREGRIRVSKKLRIMPTKAAGLPGLLKTSERGYAFFRPDREGEADVFIPASERAGAMHNDRVQVLITEQPGRYKNATGRVVRVLERNTESVVGTYRRRKNIGYVVPDDTRYDAEIYVPKGQERKARDRDKVVVAIKYGKKDRPPTGRILEILGKSDTPGMDITSIAKSFGLRTSFPNRVLAEAQALPDEVRANGRQDFRDLLTVTIDGADAKDFDDAISVERHGDETDLYVHIADVAHYVQPGSAIDKEAYRRGNSVYLPDRVLPMLPERLSNELCSLQPDQDRYAVTVRMTFDKAGKIKQAETFRSVIRSRYRLIYDDVSDLLENGEDPYGDSSLTDMLRDAERLYESLLQQREEAGALDFAFPESEIELNSDGEPIDIRRRDRRVANRIIEEFMIVTNTVVGERYAKRQLPFLYRVHEAPNEEKLDALRTVLHNLGLPLPGGEIGVNQLQEVLEQAAEKPEAALIHTLVLRSLTKARYDAEPLGHYGLALGAYSHFTAPIRRYGDLVIHRIVTQEIEGKRERRDKALTTRLENIADHISDTERIAEEAEREAEDLKKAEYMQGFIGEKFDGVISSVTSFGFFVQLENTIEGLVHIRNLPGFFVHDEEHHRLTDARNHTEYRLGDAVRIRVEAVDIDRKSIDFTLSTEGKKHEETGAK